MATTELRYNKSAALDYILCAMCMPLVLVGIALASIVLASIVAVRWLSGKRETDMTDWWHAR